MSEIDNSSSVKAKERANYYKELRKQKESYEKDLDNQKNLHEKSSKIRQETYHKEVGDIQDKYESKFDELSKKSAESVKKYQKKMDNELGKEREKSVVSLAAEKENFQKRIEEVNTEYKKEMDSKDVRQNNASTKIQKDYITNLKKKETDFIESTDQLREKQDKSTQSIIGKSVEERHDVEKNYNNLIENVKKEEIGKRNLEKNAMQDVMEKGSRDHKLALKLKDMQRDGEVSDMRSETQKRLEMRTNDEKINHEKLIASNDRKIEEERASHKKALDQTNMDHLLQKRARDYQEGRQNESIQRSQLNGLSVTPKEQEQKLEIRRLKDRSEAMDQKLGQEQEHYMENLKQLQAKNKMDAGKALQNKEIAADNRVMDVLSSERQKLDKSQMNAQVAQLAEKDVHERLTTKNEKQYKDRLSSLSETYTERLQDLNQKNTNLLEGLKREHINDKRDFSMNLENQFNQRQISLIKDFEKKQEVLLGEYEKNTSHLEKENQNLKEFLNESVTKIRKMSDQKLLNQQVMLTEQKKDSERSLHDRMNFREKELRNTIENLHENYQKKISEQENLFQNRLTELMNTYDQKFFQLQRDTTQEVSMKNNEMTRERKTLMLAFDEEKKRLVEQYENMLRNMKTAHAEYITNLNRFKKVSSNDAA